MPLINMVMFIMSLTLSLFAFFSALLLISKNFSLVISFEFFKLSSSTFEFPILLDFMSLTFSSLVLVITSSIMLFSHSYMINESLNKRFISMVMLFVLSMLLLIFSTNIISVVLGWDGLGLTSFILVAYYQTKKANSASMMTALSNRIGDSALLIAIALMVQTNSWNITQTPASLVNFYPLMFIILAAMTKSAQMPFSAWLPAAMAAPTPVSALVHSSTLVTAGVYLLIRFNPILISLDLLTPLLIIGLLTSIMASISGCLENNMKKVIALSTLSQLGLMVATLSLGFYKLAFFHLLTHAMFKALLFITCGKIIHDFSSSQDIRMMGALMSKTPFTWITLNSANFALCGIPFLAGFYSKDLIYETMMMSYTNSSMFIMFSLAIALSTIYSVRMMFSSMINVPLFPPLFLSIENDKFIMMSMKILLVPTILGGTLISWLMFDAPKMILMSIIMKPAPLFFLFSCLLLGLILVLMPTSYLTTQFMEPFSQMWYLPHISPAPSKTIMLLSSELEDMEKGWYEFLFAQGAFKTLMPYSSNLTKCQSHPISTFLSTFVISIMAAIWMLFPQSS